MMKAHREIKVKSVKLLHIDHCNKIVKSVSLCSFSFAYFKKPSEFRENWDEFENLRVCENYIEHVKEHKRM